MPFSHQRLAWFLQPGTQWPAWHASSIQEVFQQCQIGSSSRAAIGAMTLLLRMPNQGSVDHGVMYMHCPKNGAHQLGRTHRSVFAMSARQKYGGVFALASFQLCLYELAKLSELLWVLFNDALLNHRVPAITSGWAVRKHFCDIDGFELMTFVFMKPPTTRFVMAHNPGFLDVPHLVPCLELMPSQGLGPWGIPWWSIGDPPMGHPGLHHRSGRKHLVHLLVRWWCPQGRHARRN